MARPVISGGSRSKKPSVGQQRVLRDIKRAQARKQLGSIKGIAGIVGGAVIEGIGGPKARAAKGAVRLAARATGQVVNKSAKGARVVTRATTSTRGVRKPAKTPIVAKKKAEAAKQASERLATRNKTQLSRDMTKVKINPAALGSSVKSGKPTPNRGGGLKTTTGQGKKKTSKADVFEAVRSMSSRPGGSSTTTGTGAIRGTAPKPYVRITTQSGRTKATVQKPLKKTNPSEKGSAITIRKTTPRKAADVRAQAQKERRDRLRNALTPTQNPARPKTTPAQARNGGANKTDARREEIIDRYYRIRFGDRGGPTPRGGQVEPRSIDSRIAAGVEKANPSQRPSTSDWEANKLRTEALNPKSRINATVKPGKRTRVAEAIKSGDRAKIIRSTQNMRKVLREREIKQAAERARKAAEAAAKNKRGK